MKVETIINHSSRIRLERQKRSWTQEQLAERAKLSTRTVQRIESKDESSAEILRLIAEAFGLPADSLGAAAPRIHFRAPWSLTVKVITALTAVVMLALPFIISRESFHGLHWGLWGAFLSQRTARKLGPLGPG